MSKAPPVCTHSQLSKYWVVSGICGTLCAVSMALAVNSCVVEPESRRASVDAEATPTATEVVTVRFDGYPMRAFNFEGHRWVAWSRGGLIHHPDCPCQTPEEGGAQ